MAISKHIEEFHGLPVHDFTDHEGTADPTPDPGSVAWRVQVEYEGGQDFAAVWAAFTAAVDTTRVRALVIGPWWEEEYELVTPVVAALAADAGRFPQLRALFLGEVTFEECEISWLQMDDVTPLLTAYPELEELVVRGADGDYEGNGGLKLEPVKHERLRALRFESGGLPGGVVRSVLASELPALERLVFWLGTSDYGATSTDEDLAPLFSGGLFPALRHLGLENGMRQDALAAALAAAPLTRRLEGLSLALGTLTDAGAESLLGLTHLKRLDLHHHYLTQGMQERLRAALPGVELDLSEAEDPEDDWRYVANGE
ncbi:STM4015 family protein [Kitasatospora sp. NPDC051853]|uniref:STM4015 family protein n=1 Tax=Kitasatospora sp. NPDC051853 TaxID=3364058 RepID=UPI00378EDE84